jgi:germination protein M
MAKNKKGSIGCLFWIALILLVIVIFMFNQKTIAKVVKATGICKILPGLPGCDENDNQEEDLTITQTETEEEPPAEEENNSADNVVVEVNTNSVEEQAEESENPEEEEQPEPDKEEEPEAEQKNQRKSSLYFVRVNNDGSTELVSVKRTIYYVDTPLTETLNSLLSGLSTNDINNGLISMVPEGTRLQGVTVKNGVAFLDFNSNITSSRSGREGSIFLLRQLIYTCTEFSTVDKVQFLINGQIRTYFTDDGIAIDKPLSRGDL